MRFDILGNCTLGYHTSLAEREDEKMSIYQLWFAIAQHVFNGVTCVENLELFAIVATCWTVITVAMIPYYVIRRLTK